MSQFRLFIDDLLNRTDIASLIGRYIKITPSGNRYKALCPFHEEKTPSFHIQPDKQFFHCFGCGASGDAIAFISKYNNVEFYPALEELARLQGVSIPTTLSSDKNNEPEKDNRWKERLAVLQQASDYFQSMLRANQFSHKAKNYLDSRGLEQSTIELFKIGYAPPARDSLYKLWQNDNEKIAIALEIGIIKKSDRGDYYDQFRNRIIFPIHDSRGRVRGFGGRAIDNDQQPKYLNSSESDMFYKAALIYGLYESLSQRSNENWIVVEGYMDVISLHQHGFKKVVACLGTAINEQQVQWIGRYKNNISFAFDGDSAGAKAAEKTMSICLGITTDESEYRFAFLPKNEDPDSIVTNKGKSVFEDIVNKNSIPLSSMFLRWLHNQADINTIEGKAKIASISQKQLSKISSNYFKQILEKQVREITYTGYQSRFKKKPPSIKEKKIPPNTPHRLINFLVAICHSPKLFAETTLIKEIELLTPYAKDIPIDFLKSIASNPENNLATTMIETLNQEQISKLTGYINEDEHPSENDLHRLFLQLKQYYYKNMDSSQKASYLHSLNN